MTNQAGRRDGETLRHVNATLAARGGTRNVEVQARAERAADAAEREARRWWGELLEMLRRPPPAGEQRARLLAHARQLAPRVRAALAHALAGLAAWSYDHAAADAVRSLPLAYLDRAALRRTAPVLREARTEPGQVNLTWGKDDKLYITDRLKGDPDKLASLIFPPPSADTVRRIVLAPDAARPWTDRISGPNADAVADAVVTGFAAGRAPRDIARDLRDRVGLVQTSARRAARTEGQRVANRMQFLAHEELGDLVIGYQVHATLDQFTRPTHAHRSGTIYYKNPGPGQLGLAAMPHPPNEADGSMAWNCRCFLTPVLAPLEHLQTPEALEPFSRKQAEMIPDQAVYTDWWADADVARRRVAVGAGRYNAVAQQLGFAPGWAHFVNPDTGGLLTVPELQQETKKQRAARIARVQAHVNAARDLTARAAVYGQLPPPDVAPPLPPKPLAPPTRTILGATGQRGLDNEAGAVERARQRLVDRGHVPPPPEEIRRRLLEAWDRAEFAMNFKPSRKLLDGGKMIDALLADPNAKNLFDVGTGGGATSTAARQGWEVENFGTAAAALAPGERPKYGSVFWGGRPTDDAMRYGNAAFILNRDALADRATVAPRDTSATTAGEVADVKDPVNALARNQQAQNAGGVAPTHDPYLDHSDYLELQVWGHLPINRETVKGIRVKATMGPANKMKVRALAAKIGVPYSEDL